MGGTSVFRVRADDPNRNVIVETVSHLGARTVMAQRYIPEISRRRQAHPADRRRSGAVTALARIPKPGETRGNLAAGGRGVAQPLSARDREIAEALAPPLWAQGLLVVGLDVIGDYLTEVNVTSPTCFVEITEQTGFDVGGLFADALLARLRTPMIGILIVAHGRLGESLVDAVTHVLGARPPQFDVLSGRGHRRSADAAARRRASSSRSSTPATACAIFSDIYGATPCNLAAKLLKPGRVEVVAGVNLPMLVRAFTYRTKGMDTIDQEGGVRRLRRRVAHRDPIPSYAAARS